MIGMIDDDFKKMWKWLGFLIQCREKKRNRCRKNYALLQALGNKRTLAKTSSVSRWGQLPVLRSAVWRHALDIEQYLVKPTRCAHGQDATKVALRRMMKTLRIWGYEYVLKVCSKISPKGSLDFISISIWTVCRFGNRPKQRANSTRTVLIEYSVMNMSR